MISLIKAQPIVLLIAYLVIINICLFVMMGADKLKAKRGKRRVPEARLFLFVLLGGSLGGIAGIYCFRHKTKHKSFTLGFPAILILELAALVWLLI